VSDSREGEQTVQSVVTGGWGCRNRHLVCN